MFASIGIKLKTIRKDKKITLAEMAKEAHISIGLLSNIERNIKSPSLNQLHKICNVLGITINELLSEAEDKLCVKKDERQVIFHDDTSDENLSYESLVSGTKSLKAMAQVINDNKVHNSFKHIVDEFGVIITGNVTINIEGTSYDMSVGDSIFIPKNHLHSFQKSGDETCIIYWVSPNDV